MNLLVHETRTKIADEARNRRSELESERQEREQGDNKTKRLIEEAAAGGLDLEVTGVFWLFVGVILATASGEIVELLNLSN